MKLKNFNFGTDWLTTVTGLILLVATVLVTFGVITPEQSAGAQTQVGIILNAVNGIVGAVSALILLFSGKQ
jgi:uncharacterized membrane protein YecN with MAPEG domain